MRIDSGPARVGFIIAIPLLMVACAPMSEATIEALEYRRIEFQNRFILERAQCFERGGRIELHADATELNGNGVPEHRVRYYCVLSRS